MSGVYEDLTVVELADRRNQWAGKLLSDGGARVIQIEPIQNDRRARAIRYGHTALRQQKRRPAVRQDVSDTLCRIVGIDGDIRSARLQDAEDGDDHLRRALHEDTNP